jgi:hypothetical protein
MNAVWQAILSVSLVEWIGALALLICSGAFIMIDPPESKKQYEKLPDPKTRYRAYEKFMFSWRLGNWVRLAGVSMLFSLFSLTMGKYKEAREQQRAFENRTGYYFINPTTGERQFAFCYKSCPADKFPQEDNK